MLDYFKKILFILLLMLGGFVSAYTANDAKTKVELLSTQVLDVLKQNISLQQKKQEIIYLSVPVFNFDAMTSRVVGPLFNKISATKKQELVSVFKTFMETIYSNSMVALSSKQIDYTVQKVTLSNEGAIVRTVVNYDKFEAKVNYHMDKSMQISDVEVSGASLLSAYKNQFTKILNNSNAPDADTKADILINEIQTKLNGFNKSKRAA